VARWGDPTEVLCAVWPRGADEVAKAGLRAKPGPKKKGGTKGTIGRGKTKHSKLIAKENSATGGLNPMAPPRSREIRRKI
jgi:hypothetical protein